MKKTYFMAKEVSEAAQAALDNWDWEIEEEERHSSKKMIIALEHLRDYADDHDISGFRDIWDWLYEYAISTAANMD